MVGHREQLLDAGLQIVADRGVSGLTHGAVDETAKLPPGSAEQHFVTQDALVEGVTERAIERELQMAGRSGIEPTADGIAAALGAFVRRALGEDRVVTLARYALHAEAARMPSLRAFYRAGAEEVDTWGFDLVRHAGSRHPERDFGILANYVTGLVFHELALPSTGIDSTERIRSLIDTLGWRVP